MSTTFEPKRALLPLLALICMVAAVTLMVSAQSAKKTAAFKETVETARFGELVLNYSPTATPIDLALPFYPSAKLGKSWRYSATDNSGKSAGYLAQATLTTGDAPAKVKDFYLAKLGKRAGIEAKADGKQFIVFSTYKADTITAEIKSGAKAGETIIELNRAGKTKTPLKNVPERHETHRGTMI
jgi:hypothetical protein